MDRTDVIQASMLAAGCFVFIAGLWAYFGKEAKRPIAETSSASAERVVEPVSTPGPARPAGVLTIVKPNGSPGADVPIPERVPPDGDPYRYFDPKKAIAHMTFRDVQGTTESEIGAVDLAGWSTSRMPWSYVAGPAETSIGKALKDIDKERGKRGCWSGFVAEITETVGMYRGGLVVDGSKVLRFYAVRDSGDIVQESTARLCGIVTGLISFPNAAGGTTQAVQVVGLFDLPANKKNDDLDKPADFDWTKKVPKESL